MIKLDAILPEIEKSVDDRVESATLKQMDAAQLRDLVYKLVERQRWVARDPTQHFAELVDKAVERHTDMVQTKEHSVAIRQEILAMLLPILRPALPALLGSIVVEMHRPPDEHSKRTHHRLLVGFELLNGERQGPVGAAANAISGRSWWIVGLIPETPSGPIEPRYAMARHSGTLTNDGVGVAYTSVDLVTTDEAASQIRDDHFPQILERIHKRLVALTGRKVTKTTDSMWAAAERLQSALDALAKNDQ